ncbi:MAG: hypothetical protein AAGB46_05195 [Verrucomicrobiota bacterium]
MKAYRLVWRIGLVWGIVYGGFGAASDRISYNGQELFLNGLNLAWDDFANDIGPDPETPDLDHFDKVLGLIHDNGGNAMRLWLHTNGAHTPAFKEMKVTGPGKGTIRDLKLVLDLAWERRVGMILCLWSFDMQRISFGAGVTDRARALLVDKEARDAYVANSLIPMVEALKGHPAIIAWEIFNEPEGMSHEFGWDFTHHVAMSDIQAFINVCAGAIRRTDPESQVTNGSWAFYAATDVGEGNKNYYTDEELIGAGGDEEGYLDFYTVHYYDWAGTVRSPFAYDASHWGLDKPLVVAEFHVDCENCAGTPYETLYNRGYAGALAWSWTDVDDPSEMLEEIRQISERHPSESRIRDLEAPKEKGSDR